MPNNLMKIEDLIILIPLIATERVIKIPEERIAEET